MGMKGENLHGLLHTIYALAPVLWVILGFQSSDSPEKCYYSILWRGSIGLSKKIP